MPRWSAAEIPSKMAAETRRWRKDWQYGREYVMPSTREIKVKYSTSLIFTYTNKTWPAFAQGKPTVYVSSPLYQVGSWRTKISNLIYSMAIRLSFYPMKMSMEKKNMSKRMFMKDIPLCQLINFADQMALPRNELRKRSIRMTTKASQTGLHRSLHINTEP